MNDEAPEGAETMNKIRSNAETIYVFYETPPAGEDVDDQQVAGACGVRRLGV